MHQVSLRDVFGVRIPAPQETYVDRGGLDRRMKHLIDSGRHLVIYGATKQGKTSLRRRILPDSRCLIVHGRRHQTCTQLYQHILGTLNVQLPAGHEVTFTGEATVGGEAGGKAGIPFVTEAEAKATGELKLGRESKTSHEPVGRDAEYLSYVADKMKQSGRRVVVDDFHYLSEDARRDFAIDLKLFLEHEVHFILVGAWLQQNFLTHYNGDLDGRIDEIQVTWTAKELNEVLDLGEHALNIRFAPWIRLAMVEDSGENVGLLQRLAEKLCEQNNCYKTYIGSPLDIYDDALFDEARRQVAAESSARYQAFARSISQGFQASNAVTKNVYKHIMQVFVEASEAELEAGMHRSLIETRVSEKSPSISAQQVRNALQRIEQLQAEIGTNPPILAYDQDNRTLNLVDRQLLFYRRYGNFRWPWQD